MDEAHRLSRVGLQIETWSRQPAFFGRFVIGSPKMGGLSM